jgi:hypothetical protein
MKPMKPFALILAALFGLVATSFGENGQGQNSSLDPTTVQVFQIVLLAEGNKNLDAPGVKKQAQKVFDDVVAAFDGATGMSYYAPSTTVNVANRRLQAQVVAPEQDSLVTCPNHCLQVWSYQKCVLYGCISGSRRRFLLSTEGYENGRAAAQAVINRANQDNLGNNIMPKFSYEMVKVA